MRLRWSPKADGGTGTRPQVTAHERGSLVVRIIFDVAHRMPWAVSFVSRQPLKEAPAAFAARLTDVGDRLGKAAYTLP